MKATPDLESATEFGKANRFPSGEITTRRVWVTVCALREDGPSRTAPMKAQAHRAIQGFGLKVPGTECELER